MDKIISNIEQGIKDGLKQSNPVLRELRDRDHDLEITVEFFLDLIEKKTLDIPVSFMLCLLDASKAIEEAQKEYKNFVREKE